MRVNQPVTKVEYEIDGNRSIYSTTDLMGRITHANPYFVEVSGFSEEELMGSPHNMVRHPDMPAAAFADLWKTVHAGQPWTGLVKNRRKNGDYYWVEATVTPIMAVGAVTGYISVRTKPRREQIDAASKLYKAEIDRPGTLALRQGQVVRGGLLGKVRQLFQLSLGQRIAIAQSLLLVAIAGLGWIAAASQAPTNPAFGLWLGILSVVATAGSAYFWYFLTSKVVAPIKWALKAAQSIAGGDLTGAINTNRTDELGQLIVAVRQVNSNLHCIVGDIRENFGNMRAAARNIAVGNTDLSARTDSQAAALEETAASMEELAATVQKNAEHTQHGTNAANGAMATAKRGGDITLRVISTINDISDSSNKISDIVGIINGIASQTNLLALNAAVEAARAGDAGRGFAVVASEVRDLSQRSAMAAKEIKQLIDSSVERVGAGMLLANNAGKVMEEIITSVSEVNGLITDISSASSEQSAGIAQVNDAVTQMDGVTQQNAALVQEAALATDELERQATQLMQGLSVFRLKTQHIAPAEALPIAKKGQAKRIAKAA